MQFMQYFFKAPIKGFAFASLLAISSQGNCTPYQTMNFSWDSKYSSQMGANWMLSAFSLYEYLDDSTFPASKGDLSFLAGLGRLIKSAIIDANMARMARLVQHEVFGHGYRLREFGYPIIGYELNFWPDKADTFVNPFAGPSGSTSYYIVENRAHPQSVIRSMVASAGVEANAQFAESMRFRFEASDIMDSRDFYAYLNTRLDLVGYIGTTSKRMEMYQTPSSATLLKSHDLYNYTDRVNETFRINNPSAANVVSMAKLRKRYWLDLLDPYLFLSGYGYIDYIFNGETQFAYPKIGTSTINFLPLLRLNLAPYGIEHQLDTYFSFNAQKFSTHLRYSNNPLKRTYGLALRLPNIYECQDWKFSPHIAIWQQKVLFDNGAMLTILASKKIAKEFSAFAELGAKSKGYVPGYDLDHAYIAKVGLSLQF